MTSHATPIRGDTGLVDSTVPCETTPLLNETRTPGCSVSRSPMAHSSSAYAVVRRVPTVCESSA